MKILLVNPAFPVSLWDFSYCRDIDGNKFAFPPLSLATIAALTPAGHEILICDENVSPIDYDTEADLVGITGYTIQAAGLFEIADLFRSRGQTVAIGGPVVNESSLAECSLHADAVFMGEAERTWPVFLSDFVSGSHKPVYVEDYLVELSGSPVPRFDLLDLSAYSSTIIETSRGCPHSCEFCEIPVRLGRYPRTKTSDGVMAEIRELYRLGARSIFIIDDNFMGDMRRARTLVGMIGEFNRSIGYAVIFSCQFTINIASDETMLSMLRDAGFRRVFIGIESPRRNSLLTAGKRQNTLVDIVGAVRKIHSFGIVVWGAFIIGFDDDDKEIFDEQFSLIQSACIPVAMVGLLQALPGTPLYSRVAREGRLKDTDAGGIRGAVGHLSSSNISPLHMTEGEMLQGYGDLVRRLYSPENYSGRLINAGRMIGRNAHKGEFVLGKKELMILWRLLRYYLFGPDKGTLGMFLRVMTHTILFDRRSMGFVLMHLVVYKHLRTFYDLGVTGQRT